MKTINLFYYYEKVFFLMNIVLLPEKEDFYNYLNMRDITDSDYAHEKRVCKDFEIKNLQNYHYLYIQSDTLLLSNVFENFGNMCLEIYEFHPAKFLSASRLALKAVLKTAKDKLELLSGIDMFLMVENYIRGGICHSIYRYARANNKYMKVYD